MDGFKSTGLLVTLETRLLLACQRTSGSEESTTAAGHQVVLQLPFNNLKIR